MQPAAEIIQRTVLCIPGNWKNRSELVTAIAESNAGNYLFAGMVLMDLKTKAGFELEIYERDNRMKEAFGFAGRVNQVTDNFLSKIDEHSLVLYLSGETGSFEKAFDLANAANALLNAGGTGVKVETTGKAFEKEQWMGLVAEEYPANLYALYVLDSISDGLGTTYSCGMHNLGLKDVIVYQEDFQEAVNLIAAFGYYQIMESPEINVNQTFGVAANSPIFEIQEEHKQPNKGDDFFENPYGMWLLQRK